MCVMQSLCLCVRVRVRVCTELIADIRWPLIAMCLPEAGGIKCAALHRLALHTKLRPPYLPSSSIQIFVKIQDKRTADIQSMFPRRSGGKFNANIQLVQACLLVAYSSLVSFSGEGREFLDRRDSANIFGLLVFIPRECGQIIPVLGWLNLICCLLRTPTK